MYYDNAYFGELGIILLPRLLYFRYTFLEHRNNIPRLNMSLRSDTLSWFRANQSLLFLLNAACLAEKQQIQIL